MITTSATNRLLECGAAAIGWNSSRPLLVGPSPCEGADYIHNAPGDFLIYTILGGRSSASRLSPADPLSWVDKKINLPTEHRPEYL